MERTKSLETINERKTEMTEMYQIFERVGNALVFSGEFSNAYRTQQFIDGRPHKVYKVIVNSYPSL